MSSLKLKLEKIVETDSIIENAPMKNYTSFKVGGNADLLVTPKTKEQLIETIKTVYNHNENYYILGNGSNVIVRDGGFRGIIINIGKNIASISTEGNILQAQAGALLSETAREAANAGLTGLEFASGIPGSIGGAVFMNAGAYDGEIVDVLDSAEVLDLEKGEVRLMKPEELELGYRKSIFHRKPYVVLSAQFKLKEGDIAEIKEKMKEFNTRRNEKQPVTLPSAGSFFKRPEGYFAGKLIQDAGLKGLKCGGAAVSDLHSGFIVNTGGATAQDIEDLKEIVIARVIDDSGVILEPEVRIIGEKRTDIL